MNSGSIGSLKNVVGEARIIGFRRLGVLTLPGLKTRGFLRPQFES